MLPEKPNVKLTGVGKDVSKQDLHKASASDLKPMASNSRKETIMRPLLQSLLKRTATILVSKNSFAKLQFPNSNSYFGWLNSNGFNGFGTYNFRTGTCFKGSFEGSLSKGLGSLRYISGDIYEGGLLAGRQHGYGHYKSERFKYSGYFQNGKFHGKGAWKTKTGEITGIFQFGRIKSGEARDCSGVFNGIFDKSASRKWGKLTFKNGNSYNGFWTDNKFSGFGEYNWTTEERLSTKTKYVGYWENGKQHGLGMLKFNQSFVICQWSCGKKNGAGIIIASNGSCYSSIELFIDDQYKESQCIRNCQESQNLLSEAVNILVLNSKYESLDEKMNAFLNAVKKLVEEYPTYFSPINPMRIPNYEIPPGSFTSSLESKHLQQVLVENYTTFENLYKKYTCPTDECLNSIGLNLFYIDVFHKVQDINIAECLKAGHFSIRKSRIYSDDTNCSNLMEVVPFYEFFQHFVYITRVLMETEALKSKADEIRPSFFGHLATRVLLVLRMVDTNETTLFLIREAVNVNISKCFKLLHLLEEMFHDEKSFRTAYKFLKVRSVVVEGRSTEFVETIEELYGVNNASYLLFDNHFELSNLELLEIIFRTCQLKLRKNMLKL